MKFKTVEDELDFYLEQAIPVDNKNPEFVEHCLRPHVQLKNDKLKHKILDLIEFPMENVPISNDCGNDYCIEPSHLHRDGAIEKIREQTVALTKKDVLEIRKLYKEGTTVRHIAEQFGAARNNIYLIINRKTWQNI